MQYGSLGLQSALDLVLKDLIAVTQIGFKLLTTKVVSFTVRTSARMKSQTIESVDNQGQAGFGGVHDLAIESAFPEFNFSSRRLCTIRLAKKTIVYQGYAADIKFIQQ